MSAAITYFTMLSLAPLLVIAIAIAGVVFGDQLAKQEIVEQVKLFTTDNIAETVAGLIANTSNLKSGLFAGSLSVAVLIFAASAVFSQLQGAFNVIWGVPADRRQGIWQTVKTRLLGIVMVVVVGVMLLTTLGLSAVLGTVTHWFANHYPELELWLSWADRGISFLLMPIVLALLFWLVPAAPVRLSDVWPAAILTALLLSCSRYLIEFYLQLSTASEVYGAAGSLVILLVWIYMSGLVLFFGAAFSRGWTETFGSLRMKAEPT